MGRQSEQQQCTISAKCGSKNHVPGDYSFPPVAVRLLPPWPVPHCSAQHPKEKTNQNTTMYPCLGRNWSVLQSLCRGTVFPQNTRLLLRRRLPGLSPGLLRLFTLTFPKCMHYTTQMVPLHLSLSLALSLAHSLWRIVVILYSFIASVEEPANSKNVHIPNIKTAVCFEHLQSESPNTSAAAEVSGLRLLAKPLSEI